MKTVGFIKTHDNHSNSKNLSEYLVDNYENENKELILNYIKKGSPCIDWMTWLYEDNKETISIGPHGCDTDGVWIWPRYLEHYIKKHSNFKLDEEFIDYIIENQDKEISVSKEENIKIQEAYNILTDSKADKGTNLLDGKD